MKQVGNNRKGVTSFHRGKISVLKNDFKKINSDNILLTLKKIQKSDSHRNVYNTKQVSRLRSEEPLHNLSNNSMMSVKLPTQLSGRQKNKSQPGTYMLSAYDQKPHAFVKIRQHSFSADKDPSSHNQPGSIL